MELQENLKDIPEFNSETLKSVSKEIDVYPFLTEFGG